jgi:hypothetical protein
MQHVTYGEGKAKLKATRQTRGGDFQGILFERKSKKKNSIAIVNAL